MRAFVCESERVFAFVCVRACARDRVCVCVKEDTHARVGVCACVCLCVRARECVRVRAFARARVRDRVFHRHVVDPQVEPQPVELLPTLPRRACIRAFVRARACARARRDSNAAGGGEEGL